MMISSKKYIYYWVYIRFPLTLRAINSLAALKIWTFCVLVLDEIEVGHPWSISSIHPVALQPKPGLGLLCGFVAIRFHSMRLLTSRLTPVSFGGTYEFLLGFTPLAKGFSFKALKSRPPSHSHLLHNPLCLAPGPPLGGWEFGFAGRACRLNTQEAFWYLNRARLLVIV
jgi:hypothetical protein